MSQMHWLLPKTLIVFDTVPSKKEHLEEDLLQVESCRFPKAPGCYIISASYANFPIHTIKAVYEEKMNRWCWMDTVILYKIL